MSGQIPVRTVLAVGGLDPSGGAGVLVDARAIRSLGLHAAAVVSLVTVQDGREFTGARPVDSPSVRHGIEAVLRTQDVGAVKIGALGSAANVESIADLAAADGFPPVVLDPVLGSTTGGELLEKAGRELLRDRLLPAATLVTPNATEAAALTGVEVDDVEGAVRAAEQLIASGARSVLVKGGHLSGDRVTDVLLVPGEPFIALHGPRHSVGEVRGTGCALASLVAGQLALGRGLREAVEQAREGLQRALGQARIAGAGPPVLWFG